MKVKIIEVLEYVVDIDAVDEENALSITKDLYDKEKIILDSSNLSYVDFELEK